MKAEGNTYFLEELGEGIYSFRHVQTGEILHGSVGPVKEARDLYMGSSGLLKNASETLVVFDVGMGCGAQLLALLDFLNSDDAACSKLRIFSFDLEKNGLSALLAAADYFPNVQSHKPFIEQALQFDKISSTTTNGKTLEWTFVAGDFRETLGLPLSEDEGLRADAIFYDFFSPASHPWLWTYRLFEKLHTYSHSKTRLVTYSSATCVKAALAAAGWYVGHTIASGKKAKSILAAGSLSELEEPIPQKFLSTFEKSHKPFCDAEDDDSKLMISYKLKTHPQFTAD